MASTRFSLVLCIVVCALDLSAQCDCNNCDYQIQTTDTNFYITSDQLKDALGVQDLSGIKICILAGTYTKKIAFRDIEGSPGNPIRITNCGGLVYVNTSTEAIQLYDSKYVKLSGDGCTDYRYGIRAISTTNHVEAKDLYGKLTDIEISHLEIGPDSGLSGAAGIKIIDQPGCDQDTLSPRSNPNRWIMRNISVHDNYIHNVGTEGMYIGKGDGWYSTGKMITCSGVEKIASSASIQHVRIYNNVVDSTGWDGIQLKDADHDVKVYNNRITEYGLKDANYQNEGLFLGDGSVGEVFHNIVINGTGNGFQYFGLGNLNFHNNVIINSGENGLWLSGKFNEITTSGSYLRIINNTVVKTTYDGVFFENYEQMDSRIFVNNILSEIPEDRVTIKGTPTFTTISNNLFNRDATELSFASYQETTNENFADNDYHLVATSPAIDAGTDVSTYDADSIIYDIDGFNRDHTPPFDVGAYEYQVTHSCDSSWAIFINAGGNDYFQDSTIWEMDRQTEPHDTYNQNYYSYTTGSSSSFSGENPTTAPNAVLGSYRYTGGTANNALSYRIPVPTQGSNYNVTLFFAKKDQDAFLSGERRFDIAVEGTIIRTAYDIHDEAGSGANSISHTVNVTDDTLDLHLSGIGGGHAHINGIAVAKTAPPQQNEPFSVRINAGGADFNDEGVTWERDKQLEPHPYLVDYYSYTTGGTGSFSGVNSTSAPNQVLGSYRYTSGVNTRIEYKIPIPVVGAEYAVELGFARKDNDTYTSGSRKFSIEAEGQIIYSSYDVFDQAGSGASSVVFDCLVADDTLSIAFQGVSGGQAQINMIAVDGPAQSNLISSEQTYLHANRDQASATVLRTYSTDVKFFPNPAENHIQISFDVPGKYKIGIFSEEGELMFTREITSDQNILSTIDISSLPSDRYYLVKIESFGSQKMTFKILKKPK